MEYNWDFKILSQASGVAPSGIYMNAFGGGGYYYSDPVDPYYDILSFDVRTDSNEEVSKEENKTTVIYYHQEQIHSLHH